MNEIINNVLIIPIFCAIIPISGRNIPTIPQLKPPMNPDIILLYSGIVLWAITILIDTDSIVTKPVKTKSANDNAGNVFVNDEKMTVSINGTISDV